MQGLAGSAGAAIPIPRTGLFSGLAADFGTKLISSPSHEFMFSPKTTWGNSSSPVTCFILAFVSTR
jgi:hypothetical protein